MQDKYDGSKQMIGLRHLVNEKYSSVKKLAEQTDAVSIERNLNLFNQMLLNGAILRKEYNKSPKNPKVILDLISKVLEIISSFGSDGGLGMTVYQEMRTIIMSAFVLENFIQQKIRPLTADEITDGIPSLLFPMINELFRLAEIYCRTVLIGKASIRRRDYVGFQTALQEIPMDERLSIIKLISSENISEYSESTVLDFIKPYDCHSAP